MLIVLCGLGGLCGPLGAQQQADSLLTPATQDPALAPYWEKAEAAHKDANYGDSIGIALKGADLAHSQGKIRPEADFVQRAAYDLWLMGEFPKAVEMCERLMKIADNLDDDRYRSTASRILGSVYYGLRDIERSRHYNELALEYATKAGDERLRNSALNNLGNLLADSGDYATAKRYQEEVLAYRTSVNDLWNASGSITNLADIAFKQGDFKEALRLQEEALAMRIKSDDHRGEVRSLRQVAEAQMKLGRYDEALDHLVEARRKGEAIGGHQLLADVYADLAQAYEHQGDLRHALDLQRLADTERDALAGERTRLRVADLDAEFDLTQKEHTIELLARERLLNDAQLRVQTAELKASNAQRYALGACVILAVLAVLALIAKLRAETQATRQAKEAQEAAEATALLKSRIIGIVSHDVRSPLRTISHLADELKDELKNQGVAAEPCDWISVEADRVAGFLDDLLSSEMLDSGKFELRKAEIDFTRIAKEVVARQKWNADAKQQSLYLREAATPLPKILGDYARLYQVVVNLVSNAIKYTPARKAITVALESSEKAVTLRVSDEGPGIAPEDIPRLFNAYARLANSPTGGESSHGLGLSIAREIVELHGGTIAVERAETGGSTFVVALPTG